MSTIEKTSAMTDRRRVVLSTLWIFAVLNYLYADVVTLFFNRTLQPGGGGESGAPSLLGEFSDATSTLRARLLRQTLGRDQQERDRGRTLMPRRDLDRARRTHRGAIFARRELADISGGLVTVPDGRHLLHLQLRRFAGCPICSLHLQSVARRHDEIVRAGIREVVVFHSFEDELRKHAADLPFAIVADPHKRLYVEFGVEAAPRALLHPSAWAPFVHGILRRTWATLRRRGHLPPLLPHGGPFGLPADFLIAKDGRVIASKYGNHAFDQWSVDELLALAQSDREGEVQD